MTARPDFDIDLPLNGGEQRGDSPPEAAVRVAVLVSGGGTNLQALIHSRTAGQIPSARLVLVVSSKADAYALKRAEQAGIPARVLAAGVDPSAFDAALLALLQKHRVQLVVLAGFLPILGRQVLAAYSDRIINVHPSLIPSFCGTGYYGLRVHQAALARGVKLTGATVHLVNDIVDGGEILLQKSVPVLENDTPEILQQRVMEQAEWLLLPQAVELMCGRLSERWET